MEPPTQRPELIAIVGPTASGKSSLALEIAKLIPSEIICADSRTIYKGMDIGTAKPSHDDQKKVKHWGIDLVAPGTSFSAYQFKEYALSKIDEIKKRSKMPILVGGTGLYVDSVLYDFNFTVPASENRKILESRDVNQLQAMITKKGLVMPENNRNKLHLIRTLEREGLAGTKKTLKRGTLYIGLLPSDERIRKNIEDRAKLAFEQGAIDETKELLDLYSEDTINKTGAIMYKTCLEVLKGNLTEQTATTTIAKKEWQYARRQKTWFKRNPDIRWFSNSTDALNTLKSALNN